MQKQLRRNKFNWMFERYIAHRGYHNPSQPENTMGAFENAIKEGFNIELDLHLSKDDQVIVFHDDDMERLTGVKGKPEDSTYEELLKLNILGTEAKIPLFKDVLNLINGQVGIVIELKTNSVKNELLVAKLMELLKGYKGDYVVQSFDPTLVSKVRKANKDIIRGQLVCDFRQVKGMAKWKSFLLRKLHLNFLSKPDFINTEQHYYTSKIKRIHKRKPVICWTVRSKEEQVAAEKIFDKIIFEKFNPRG